jgi:uncharacterized protein YndB with AHSA1/START domain
LGTLSLEITRVVRASAQRVYEAWTHADQLKAWHCPEGMTISHTQCDARVGGRYVVNMVDTEGRDHRAVGEYLELVPASRIVLTWDWEVGGGGGTDTRVTVLLRSLAENESEITLIHERFDNEPCRLDHIGGWTGALNSLKRYLSAIQGT